MLVAKWGNSLAIRIPSNVIDVLDLKEGDDVEVLVWDSKGFALAKTVRNKQIRERILERDVTLPEDFNFDLYTFK